MSIRILINGAFGKMGAAAVNTLTNHKEFVIVATTNKSDSLEKAILNNNPQVVLDFTNAESVKKNLATIIALKVHPVIGTTGLLKKDVLEFTNQCEKIKLGGIIAPNFSLGALLMMLTAKKISQYFTQAEIIEMHHPNKKDSPSGSAIYTAEMLDLPTIENESFIETLPNARGSHYKNTHIHAIRLPGLLAGQQIIFGNTGETLTLSHQTIERSCFMPGVILACQKVITLKKMIYGLENLL